MRNNEINASKYNVKRITIICNYAK